MDAASGTKSAVSGADVDDWVPWAELLDASEAPYFRWFHGARTNACFNAVDRHCLEGRGDDCAMTILPEEVTPTNPRVNVTRRELLGAVAAAAKELRDAHGLRPRDRVLFHMPTDATHCAYMLACQRIGVTYSATAADSVEDVLASRVADLRPALVIAYDAPVLHGGVPIDCAAKLRRAAPTSLSTRSPVVDPGQGSRSLGRHDRRQGARRRPKTRALSSLRERPPALRLVHQRQHGQTQGGGARPRRIRLRGVGDDVLGV